MEDRREGHPVEEPKLDNLEVKKLKIKTSEAYRMTSLKASGQHF
jgi:hypothetical protein